METSAVISPRGSSVSPEHAPRPRLGAVLFLLIGLAGKMASGQNQPAGADDPGAQVLTRGPVHEAFAGVITFNPEPGMVVAKAPPDAIEEIPPEERPEGDNVAWIPGYWAWDDDARDFIWISGTWRALPPGREWLAGYWGRTSEGYQWTSGYWADAAASETTYLPEPPATVERGPNVDAPSPEYSWTPGCWIWSEGRYAWRAGYWVAGRADWDWAPAHYVWTPRGYIFVDGFWDYPVEQRGVLFAPVNFEADVRSRRDYSYSPTIVIDLSGFTDNLFLRPSYQHYYYGDYYNASYAEGGYYTSASFRSSRSGYDSFYSHDRWAHREDREWEHREAAAYQYRRDNVDARPPRTWAAQISINLGTTESKRDRAGVALSIDQLAKRSGSPLRFQPVARVERQALVQQSLEVRKSRDQRQTLEAGAVVTAARGTGRVSEPVKVQLPRSPIVARPSDRSGRDPAPPQVPHSPKPDLAVVPGKDTPGRPSTPARTTNQPEPRKPEVVINPPARQGDAGLRDGQARPETQAHAAGPAGKAQDESQRNAKEAETKAQVAKDAAAKTAQDAQRSSQDSNRKAQQESDQRAKDAAAAKERDQSQRNAKDAEAKAQLAKDVAAKSTQDAQRNARDSDRKTQQEADQRAKDAAAAKERDQSQRNAKDAEAKAQLAKDATAKSAQDAQRNTQDSNRKAQQESDQRAADAAARERDQSQRNARDAETKAQVARDAAARSAQDAQRNTKDSDRKAQQEADQRARDAVAKAHDQSRPSAKEVPPPAAERKPAEKSAKDAQKNDGKDKPATPEDAPDPKSVQR